MYAPPIMEIVKFFPLNSANRASVILFFPSSIRIRFHRVFSDRYDFVSKFFRTKNSIEPLDFDFFEVIFDIVELFLIENDLLVLIQ